jgi:hypothetical protein
MSELAVFKKKREKEKRKKINKFVDFSVFAFYGEISPQLDGDRHFHFHIFFFFLFPCPNGLYNVFRETLQLNRQTEIK